MANWVVMKNFQKKLNCACRDVCFFPQLLPSILLADGPNYICQGCSSDVSLAHEDWELRSTLFIYHLIHLLYEVRALSSSSLGPLKNPKCESEFTYIFRKQKSILEGILKTWVCSLILYSISAGQAVNCLKGIINYFS